MSAADVSALRIAKAMMMTAATGHASSEEL
jgi:hypothetical protein